MIKTSCGMYYMARQKYCRKKPSEFHVNGSNFLFEVRLFYSHGCNEQYAPLLQTMAWGQAGSKQVSAPTMPKLIDAYMRHQDRLG